MKRVLVSILAALLCTQVWAGSPMLLGVGSFSTVAVVLPTGMVTPLMADNRNTAMSTSAASFMAVMGGDASASAANRDTPIPITGSVKDLRVRFPTTLTQGTYTIALAINGSVPANSPTCQITTSTTTCNDLYATTGNQPTIAVSDRLSWRTTPSGTPTAQAGQVQISATFTSYGATGFIVTPYVNAPSNSATNYTAVGSYMSTTNWATTDAAASAIMPTGGTIDSIYVESGVVAGGTSFAFQFYKNGAAQGTSLCSVTAAIQRCSVTGLGLTTVRTDKWSIESVPTGTPSASFTFRATVGWTPTTSGQAVVMLRQAALSGGATRYLPLVGAQAPGATETGFLQMISSASTIKNLYVEVAAGLAGANTRQTVLRKGTGAGQADQTVTCTNSTGATSTICEDNSNTFATTAGDLLNWASVASGAAPATTSNAISAVISTP